MGGKAPSKSQHLTFPFMAVPVQEPPSAKSASVFSREGFPELCVAAHSGDTLPASPDVCTPPPKAPQRCPAAAVGEHSGRLGETRGTFGKLCRVCLRKAALGNGARALRRGCGSPGDTLGESLGPWREWGLVLKELQALGSGDDIPSGKDSMSWVGKRDPFFKKGENINQLFWVEAVAQGLPTTAMGVWREDAGGSPQSYGRVPERPLRGSPSPWPQTMECFHRELVFPRGLHQTCLCSTAMDGNTARTPQELHNFRTLCFGTPQRLKVSTLNSLSVFKICLQNEKEQSSASSLWQIPGYLLVGSCFCLQTQWYWNSLRCCNPALLALKVCSFMGSIPTNMLHQEGKAENSIPLLCLCPDF